MPGYAEPCAEGAFVWASVGVEEVPVTEWLDPSPPSGAAFVESSSDAGFCVR
jgi:hypothetical protein